MQSCVINSRQRLFLDVAIAKIFCQWNSQKYLVSESRGAPNLLMTCWSAMMEKVNQKLTWLKSANSARLSAVEHHEIRKSYTMSSLGPVLTLEKFIDTTLGTKSDLNCWYLGIGQSMCICCYSTLRDIMIPNTTRAQVTNSFIKLNHVFNFPWFRPRLND